MELSIVKSITVRFCEVDSLNIVWHGHYLKYFEEAREEFGKKYQLRLSDFFKYGCTTYISKVELEYIRSLVNSEIITVEVKFKESGFCKIVFEYKILNEQGQLACRGVTEQVVVDRNKKLILHWPHFMQEWRNKYCNSNTKGLKEKADVKELAGQTSF